MNNEWYYDWIYYCSYAYTVNRKINDFKNKKNEYK